MSPAAPAQLSANSEAPHTAWLAGERELLQVATSAVGLGIDITSETSRIIGSTSEFERLLIELDALGSMHAKAMRRFLRPAPAWKLKTRELALDRPIVMGILNLTDDSFSGDGVGRNIDGALGRADALRSAGAAIIDVGAESARADRPVLEETEEAALVRRAITALVGEGFLVSSDTYKPAVARAALEAGAEIVNDISGLTLGTGAAAEAARAGAGYVLNYSYSVPKRRPNSPPLYADVATETAAWMERRLTELDGAGLAPETIAIDPGIAFGKSHEEDIQMLRRIGELRTFGQPVLLAHSRKNFIGSVGGQAPAERDLETHIVSALAYAQGARIFRVHDAVGARRALGIAAAIIAAEPGAFAPDGESWPWRAGASGVHMTKAEPDKAAPSGQRW